MGGECWDHQECLMYKGPFKSVTDDDGHEFIRGQNAAVCRKTFEIFKNAVYKDYFYFIQPNVVIADKDVNAFDCSNTINIRSVKELKGSVSRSSCDSVSDCC